MLSIISQVRRLYNDDGRNDVSFFEQESKLKESISRLKEATEKVTNAAQRLSYALREQSNIDQLH